MVISGKSAVSRSGPSFQVLCAPGDTPEGIPGRRGAGGRLCSSNDWLWKNIVFDMVEATSLWFILAPNDVLFSFVFFAFALSIGLDYAVPDGDCLFLKGLCVFLFG